MLVKGVQAIYFCSVKFKNATKMKSQTLDKIAGGASPVMFVVNADDLKTIVSDMWNAHVSRTQEAIEADRETPALTRQAVARKLNVTLSTLWRWDKTGYLKPAKIGNKVLYRASDVEALLRRKGVTA